MTGLADGAFLYPPEDLQNLTSPDAAAKVLFTFDVIFAQLRTLQAATGTAVDGAAGAAGSPGMDGRDGEDGGMGPEGAPGGAALAPFVGSQAPGSFWIATGKFGLHGKRLALTAAQRGTLQGTARLVISG